MEELFNRYISKKLRKRGKEYKLSENSQRSFLQFGCIQPHESRPYFHNFIF